MPKRTSSSTATRNSTTNEQTRKTPHLTANPFPARNFPTCCVTATQLSVHQTPPWEKNQKSLRFNRASTSPNKRQKLKIHGIKVQIYLFSFLGILCISKEPSPQRLEAVRWPFLASCSGRNFSSQSFSARGFFIVHFRRRQTTTTWKGSTSNNHREASVTLHVLYERCILYALSAREASARLLACFCTIRCLGMLRFPIVRTL
ncbi:hypothetical protein J3F83DRAFT_752528 [Trichoderma novae-zelandiae]